MAMAKRAHKTLYIDQKLLGKISYIVLSSEYGIGRSTISDIKKCEMELKKEN